MSFLSDFSGPVNILFDGPPTLDGDEGGWSAEMDFWVGEGTGGTAADISAFLTLVGGTVEAITYSGITVERIVPLRHPYMNDLVATRVRCRATGGVSASSILGRTDAKIRVEFGTVPYSFGGDTPLMVERHSGSAQGITLPGRAYAVSGVPLTHDVAVGMPVTQYSATFYNVPTVNVSVYEGLLGQVNNATFLGCAAETLRFDGFQDEIATKITFTQTRTVTLSFLFRPRSWNQVLLPTGVWGTPLNINDSSKLYTASNFTPLLS